MAETRQKDFLAKLADAGEGAISRVAGSQTTARLLESVNGLRERMDELQRRIVGLDRLEKRVEKLEKTVAELSKPKTTRSRAASGTTARKRSSSSSPATRRKSSS